MQILNSIFGGLKQSNYTPDFQMSEYDNWLNFLENGGSDKEWKSLKSKNNWVFRDDTNKVFMKYQNELQKVFKKYLEVTTLIDEQWSVLIKSKDYSSKLADKIEKECHQAIKYYAEVRTIDLKYGENPMTGSKAYTKLAILYERQGDYEKSIEVCKMAYSIGMDERGRMIRMIKKSGRLPTKDELMLIDDD